MTLARKIQVGLVDLHVSGVLPRQLTTRLRSCRVVYDATAVSKNDAWQDLWRNTPSIVIEGQSYIPYFEPQDGVFKNGEKRRKNPYRKDHIPGEWAWTVDKWVKGKARVRKPKRSGPRPRTWYQRLLSDDWA